MDSRSCYIAIHHLFEEQAKNNPHKKALIYKDASLSYLQLNQKCDVLACHLINSGATKNKPIAIFIERGFDMVISLLAILKTGAAYLPIAPDFPAERIKHMLEESQCEILLTQNSLLRKAKGVLEKNRLYCEVIPLDKEWEIEKLKNKTILNSIEQDSLAYIIYTSGSTGQPKGIQVYHDNVINILLSMANKFQITTDDNALAIIPLTFDVSVADIFLPLITGATLIVAQDEDTKDAEKLIKLIDKHTITFMQATPPTWRLLLDAGWEGSKPLKALCGGEALNIKLARELAKKVGRLWNVYGPAEATVWVMFSEIKPTCQQVTLGQVFDNTTIYIVDENLNQQKVGVPGELYISGKGLAKGYLKRDALTKEKFITHSFNGQDNLRLYRTGDRARLLDSGEIEFIDRYDNQVKVRGFRIEPSEIENQLLSHERIKQCVVIAKPITSAESNDLIAYVTKYCDSDSLEHREIHEFLSGTLPQYMIPNFFVIMAKLPINHNGKVDKRSLPAPDLREKLTGQELAAEFNLLELQLARIWGGGVSLASASTQCTAYFF